MKSLLTVSGVVFAHICIFLLLVNGCRGSAGDSNEWKSDTSIYSAGATAPASAQPARSVPAEAQPASASPATGTPAQAGPAPAETEKTPAAGTPEQQKNAESAQATKSEAATTANSAETTHTVASGEFLSTIALRYGLTAKELADANGIALNSTLRVGQKLKIPPAKPKTETQKATPEGEIYVVQKGDVLGTIAQKHKVSVKQIKEANNLKNDVIRVGQKLVIPSKTAKNKNGENGEEKASAPATKKEENAQQPAEAQPAPAKNGDDTASAADENLAMPEGGFGGYGYSKDEGNNSASPASSSPEENATGPAESTPAAGTPAAK